MDSRHLVDYRRAMIYSYVNHQHYEQLEGAKRITAMVAFGLLLANLVFRTLPLLLPIPAGGPLCLMHPRHCPAVLQGFPLEELQNS